MIISKKITKSTVDIPTMYQKESSSVDWTF